MDEADGCISIGPAPMPFVVSGYRFGGMKPGYHKWFVSGEAERDVHGECGGQTMDNNGIESETSILALFGSLGECPYEGRPVVLYDSRGKDERHAIPLAPVFIRVWDGLGVNDLIVY